MADCEPVHVDLAPTFGIQFWGLIVSIFFLGASLVQAYLYYMNNPDGWFMRTFVTVTLVLDVVGTVLVSDAMHFYLITSFGNPAGLVQMTQTFIGEIVLAIVTILMSQHFYASRVLTAGKSNKYGRIAAVVIVSRTSAITFTDIHDRPCGSAQSVGSFASFGSALGRIYTTVLRPRTESLTSIQLAACIKLYLTGRGFTSLEQPNYKTLISAWSFSNGLCDAIATFSMCYFLTSYKSSFKSTTSVVNSLFLFSVNRGFLVFATQIGLVTAYLAAPSKGYWTPFHLVLPKLHVNTLLAMSVSSRSKFMQTDRLIFSHFCRLNSRPSLRSRMEGRVNVLEGSTSSNPSQYLTPIRLRSITTSEGTAVDSKTMSKDLPETPEYPTHNGVHVTQSFLTFSDNDTRRTEVGDAIKGHSFA
ncbi:hypothetical protein ACEPAI_1764 [Sanghuangporus weigelae]